MDKNQLKTVGSSSLFRKFSSEELNLMLNNIGKTVFLKKGAAVIHKGECAVILSGSAVIYSGIDKLHNILRFAGEKEVIGLAGLFSAEKIMSDVRVCGDSQFSAYILTSDEVKSIMDYDSSGRFRDTLLFILSSKVAFLNTRITTLSSGSSSCRLAGYILSSADDSGCFNPDMTMKALADLLCIGRASLYRACDRLAGEGAISYIDGKFYIKDRELLIAASGKNEL